MEMVLIQVITPEQDLHGVEIAQADITTARTVMDNLGVTTTN